MSENTYPPAPTANYTDQQNINYGFFNAEGQFLFNPVLNISGEYVSPATLPQFPIRGQGDASQISRNNYNKSVFAALNMQSQQVKCNVRSLNGPIFKSYREQMAYIQGQYTQAIPGTTSSPTYSVSTLFNPQQSCVNYSNLIQLNGQGANFYNTVPAAITGLTFASNTVLTFRVTNASGFPALTTISFSLTGYNFSGTTASVENQTVATVFSNVTPTKLQITPITNLQSYSIIKIILPTAVSSFTSVGLNRVV